MPSSDLVPPFMRLVPLLAVVVGAAALAACDEATAPACDGGVAEIRFDTSEVRIPRIDGGQFVAVELFDACGEPAGATTGGLVWDVSDTTVLDVWSATGSGHQGFVSSRAFGTADLNVTVGDVEASLPVEVYRPETEAENFTVIDSAGVGSHTRDLWIHGGYAYSSSSPWGSVATGDEGASFIYTYRLDGAGGITLLDSLALPALVANDIKISPDGSFGAASQEIGDETTEGFVLLDLANPAAPTAVATVTGSLGPIHNVWIDSIGGRDYVFAAGHALTIVDVTDRTAPVEVAHYDDGTSLVHDVYVRDGLAFVSHWNDGLVILDVGNGVAGGSPDAPVEISTIATEGGHVHNAWYWPARELVFVGDERFLTPSTDGEGVVHVVDVSDMANPVEVATYAVPGDPPHNFWMDEDRGILFVGWYGNGLRAIDVTGELAGALETQGRQLGYIIPSGARGAGRIWAPQLHDGLLYLADTHHGLWSVRFDG